MVDKTNNLTKKGDFIEIDFIARDLTSNQIFDTNILNEAKKINPQIKETKPLVACIGKGFVVKGLDESLENKELNKKYSTKIIPEKAFGLRNKDLVRLIPLKIFESQKVYPQPGMTFALDNNLVKIISVSGGRVLVDFNNPLAGKDIEYEFTIKKIIEDTKERVSALQSFLFGQIFDFDIDEPRKMIVFKDIKLMGLLEAFREKFKEFLGYNVEILAKPSDNKSEVKS